MSDRSHLIETGKPFAFDAQRDAEFEHLVTRYPTRESLILPSLWLVQEQEGWISAEAMAYVADRIGTFASKVYEVATFYSMFETEKVGRHNVAFCTNISCWLNGAEALVAHAESRLGCKLGESTADGRVYLKREEECVAACCGAPVVVINGHYHEKLTPAKVDELLDGLE